MAMTTKQVSITFLSKKPQVKPGAKCKWIPAFAGMTKGAGTTKDAGMTSAAGFTLVELLVALMVSSIILASVATLAFAMGAANDSSEDVSFKQAHIRQTTLRLSELIRNCKLVTLSGAGDDLAVWRGDDDVDNEIDPAELVYIEAGAARDYIKMLEFPGAAAGTVSLANVIDGSAKSLLISAYDERRAELLPQCSNVQFYPAGINQQSSFVSISFDIDEAQQSRHYQINATVRCRAENLLSGSTIVSDDD